MMFKVMSFAKWFPVFLLRLLALGGTIAATIVMVTSHDSSQVFGLTFEAKFTNSPTFIYFVVVNAIASGYSLIALLFPSKNLVVGRVLLVLDMIMTLLLDSSISACLALAQVGKKGNYHAGWLPICGQVSTFCDHVTGALIAGFAASILYFLILLYSFYNGDHFLVVTHKSILRALICTALGLGPERFRSIDVNNGGLCVFSINKQGEGMLKSLNMTAHMYSDHTYHY